MSESGIPSHSSSEKVELSIHIDSELLDQIKHLTNDPSKVIETAIKQWLRGERREDELALGLRRNPPVPPRGEWNDWGSRVNGDGARKSAGCKVSGCESLIARALECRWSAKATGCGREGAGSPPNLGTLQGDGKDAIASPRLELLAASDFGVIFKLDC
jgi:hypothetical protein